MPYVELHARSAFSFLEGASLPEEYAAACADQEMPALALLDRDGVYGAPRFHLAAKKAGIRAHIGAEVTCTDGHRYPLLASTRAGYQNLCRLITRMKMRARKGEGAVTRSELAEHSGGLICLAPALDPELLEIFGKRNIYAEIQRHFDREEEVRNQARIETARGLGVPLVATNGVRHAFPAQREILDVLTCVRHKVTLA
ncbi:MAG: PHP domain-containing protein, partial [Acidobacteria bacterium]|nr:PHP domain-containing protein [Acidobacteriota bacterium]